LAATGSPPHVGIVAKENSPTCALLALHNIGYGVMIDDVPFAFTITGKYRYLPSKLRCIQSKHYVLQYLIQAMRLGIAPAENFSSTFQSHS
jgi:hypothetical protein